MPICYFSFLLPMHTLPKITLNINCNVVLPFKNSILISIQNNGFYYDMFMYVNLYQLIMPILLLTSLTPLTHPTGPLPLLNISPYIYTHICVCVCTMSRLHMRENTVFSFLLWCASRFPFLYIIYNKCIANIGLCRNTKNTLFYIKDEPKVSTSSILWLESLLEQ